MSVDTSTRSPSRHSMPVLKSNGSIDENIGKDENSLHESNSLHSYHLWLKEKQIREENEKKSNVKVEEEDEDSGEDNFRVDAVLERGPSPPESENSNSYEWSYEEQFKQVSRSLNLNK